MPAGAVAKCKGFDVAGMSAKHVLMSIAMKMMVSSSSISKQQLTLLLLLGCGGILAASASAAAATTTTTTTTSTSTNNDGTDSNLPHLLRRGNNNKKNDSVSKSIESTEDLPWYHPTRMLVPNEFCPASDTITTLSGVRTGQYGSSTGDCFYMYWDPSKCDLASGKTCPLYGKRRVCKHVFLYSCVHTRPSNLNTNIWCPLSLASFSKCMLTGQNKELISMKGILSTWLRWLREDMLL